MARTLLTNVKKDLVTDSGAVLWSLARGEQLEFPITLNFLENASLGYTYEAVIMEGANVVDQTERPKALKVAGVSTTLVVRVPSFIGEWNAATAYNREEVVSYSGEYYKLSAGTARVSVDAPPSDPAWAVHDPRVVYLQFPETLGDAWSPQPGPNYSVYGFIELRVTEPADAVYQRTWKPVRGMIELLFSPTEAVP